MKCGACAATLTTEAEEYLNGRTDWWICKTCYILRKLTPYDMPETAAEQEQWDELFKGHVYFERLDKTIERLAEASGRKDNKKE